MPFPAKLLNEGEEVVLDLRPHWSFLARPITAVVVAVVAAVAVRTRVRTHTDALLLPLLAAAVVALVWLGVRYTRWATTNFVVTTDRLIFRSGVLSKQGREIPLERVNDISYHQSLIERLLGAGDLMIESGGEEGQERFSRFPRPARVQNEIYRQIDLVDERRADRTGPHRDLSPLEQIDRLDDLRRRGVISQAEFEAKKTQLLDRL